MVCGLGSGLVSCVFMNPIDVIRTRFYNQHYVNGKGSVYSSGMDAFQKISQKEGFKAFYKGFTSHFLRIGPHFCLTFVFLGMIRRQTTEFYLYKDRKETFEAYDTDHDGKLNITEINNALQKIFVTLNENAPDKSAIEKFAASILLKSGEKDGLSQKTFPIFEQEVRELYRKRMA